MRIFLILLLVVEGSSSFGQFIRTDVDSTKIYGVWDWVWSSGGQGGEYSPETEGFTKTLEYRKDGKALTYKNGVIENEGTFKFKLVENNFSHQKQGLLIESYSLDNDVWICNEDSLYLSMQCSDCGSGIYIRRGTEIKITPGVNNRPIPNFDSIQRVNWVYKFSELNVKPAYNAGAQALTDLFNGSRKWQCKAGSVFYFSIDIKKDSSLGDLHCYRADCNTDYYWLSETLNGTRRNWSPGYRNGHAVNVQITLIIKYLENGKVDVRIE